MKKLISEIEKKYKVYRAAGCTADAVIAAEKSLGVRFSEEYRNYVMEYGAISFGPNEFTGLAVDDYIDVVTVTKREKELNQAFPKNSIVIQNLGIEGIIIIQDEDGTIYQMDESGKKKFAANGFVDYLKTII